MEILGYLGALFTGLSLGLIGGGGSILIVPVLVYLFNINPSLATAYSLFVVGTASVVGSIEYARKGLIDYKTAVIFAFPSFLGVFAVRAWLVPQLPQTIAAFGTISLSKDVLIMLVFAVVMLLASISMIRKNTDAPSTSDEQQQNQISYNYPMIAIEGLGVGAITGFVGAGGGFLIIPALVILARLPMKLAVGTSLIIIASKSLLGFLGDLSVSQAIHWVFLLKITATAIGGIFIGSSLSSIIPGKKLKPAFGWFVLVMGIYIITKQIFI